NRYPVCERGLLALDGDRGALAAAVVAKAVVPALQLLAADSTTFREGCAAVRAAVDEHVGLAARVAPQCQLFAETFDADGITAAQIFRFEDRVPAIAQPELQPRVDGRRTLHHACIVARAQRWVPALAHRTTLLAMAFELFDAELGVSLGTFETEDEA